jgi:hypothetical protein
MTSRRRILLLVLLGTTACWGVFLALRPREPRYHGTPYTDWLQIAAQPADKVSPEQARLTQAALLAIGTNALPTLLRMLRYEKSPLRTWLELQLRYRLGWSPGRPRLNYAEMATGGFRVLGSDARGAIPELVAMLNKPDTASGAAEALRKIEASRQTE